MIMLSLRKQFNLQPFNFIINFIIVTDFGYCFQICLFRNVSFRQAFTLISTCFYKKYEPVKTGIKKSEEYIHT